MIEVKFDPTPDALIAKLQGLEDDLQKKALRSGLVRAIKPIKASMKSLAPKMTGKLSQSIGHANVSATGQARIGAGAGAGGVTLLVGVVRKVGGRSQGMKGIWHEHGTKKMSSHPFIKPALEQNQGEFESLFYTGLQAWIKRQGL